MDLKYDLRGCERERKGEREGNILKSSSSQGKLVKNDENALEWLIYSLISECAYIYIYIQNCDSLNTNFFRC